VLDCIASGAIWVDMADCGIDVLISAPAKRLERNALLCLVMLGERARAAIETTTSNSFAMDLKKWLSIMETYEKGGHAYHATMPTDSLIRVRGCHPRDLRLWSDQSPHRAVGNLGTRCVN
jgi:aspartate aminotransferase-like enzyme